MHKTKKRNNARRASPAKQKTLLPVPTFETLEEEARFWGTHDTTEYKMEDLDETIEVSQSFKARLQKRKAVRLAELLGLAPEQWQKTQKIARRKKMPTQAVLKRWIDEGLQREAA